MQTLGLGVLGPAHSDSLMHAPLPTMGSITAVIAHSRRVTHLFRMI